MRILMLIQRPQARGAELFASHLGDALIEMGHEVRMITLFEGGFDLPFSGTTHRLNRNSSHRFFDYGAWKAIHQILLNFNPDIVQAMGADTLKFMVFSKIIFGWKGKTVFYNGSVIGRYIRSKPVRLFNQWLYKSISGIVAVSKASQLDFENLFSFRLLHEVIPVGILIPEKISLKAPLPEPVLVHIGGFTFEKNHPELLQVFSTLLAIKPDSKLLMIGEGPLRRQTEELVEKKDLAHAVSFLGAHPDPFALVPKNAILVLPSKIEGMPAVIGEAFIHRIPVVAYDVGAVSELVVAHQTGWLVPANDSIKMLESILEITELSENSLSGILDAAEQFARENLELKRVAMQYEGFYSRLLFVDKT
ncbi:Glycosyltransferase involved in cell wall bisynthesis [Rhodonellum ikkaensis]|nr:Glycosyltransferase involved in cell wall bisynthesis [Rhodonellum ikkaensis]